MASLGKSYDQQLEEVAQRLDQNQSSSNSSVEKKKGPPPANIPKTDNFQRVVGFGVPVKINKEKEKKKPSQKRSKKADPLSEEYESKLSGWTEKPEIDSPVDTKEHKSQKEKGNAQKDTGTSAPTTSNRKLSNSAKDNKTEPKAASGKAPVASQTDPEAPSSKQASQKESAKPKENKANTQKEVQKEAKPVNKDVPAQNMETLLPTLHTQVDIPPPPAHFTKEERRLYWENARKQQGGQPVSSLPKGPSNKQPDPKIDPKKGATNASTAKNPALSSKGSTPSAAPQKHSDKGSGSTAEKKAPKPKASKEEASSAAPKQKSKPEKPAQTLLSHLPSPNRKTPIKNSVLGFGANPVHPAIIEFGLKCAEGQLTGSTARCMGLLLAFKKFIEDFELQEETVFFKDLVLSPQIAFLVDCRPLSVSMANAINYVKSEVQSTKTMGPKEAKAHVLEKIEDFITDKILGACEVITKYGSSKISNGDVILVYSKSFVVESLIKAAHASGKKFSVIIVESGVSDEGKHILKNLGEVGIKCAYATLNSIAYLMKDVTKVLVGAYTMTFNGCLISRIGTAIVGMMAHAHHIPFIICCETYKLTDRVQLGSISWNELGLPEELLKQGPEIPDWDSIPRLNLVNLKYDLTPSEFITMVITDIGVVPPTSVPVIVREHLKSNEDEY